MATLGSPTRSKDYSAVREDIHEVSDKVRAVDEKINALDSDWRRIPERVEGMEDNLTARSSQIDELLYKNRLHSAKINLLQKELKQVNLENDMLRDYVEKQGGGLGYSPRDQPLGPGQIGREREPERDRRSPTPLGGDGRPDGGQYDGPPVRKDEGTVQRREENVPPYLRNSSGYGARPSDDQAPTRKQKMHFGMERYYNFDSSLISANEAKYRLYLGSNMPQEVPQRREQKQPYYGAFYFMRFHNSGLSNVDLGMKSMLTILKNCQGLVLGMAEKDRIFVMENSPDDKNWTWARKRSDQGYLMTENALALLWFTDQNSAEHFFDNKKNNRFREHDFPTPHGYEVFFVPANCTPAEKIHISYLCIELKDVNRYDPADLTQFEGELCSAILRLVPDSLPMIVSSRRREQKKPGNMLSIGSKLYVSMFRNQADIDYVYRSGKIHELKEKWRLGRPMQIFSFTLLH